MKLEKKNLNKWKKAIFGAALGTMISAAFALFLYFLSGQALYLAIIGLGAGMGFSVGGGLETRLRSD